MPMDGHWTTSNQKDGFSSGKHTTRENAGAMPRHSKRNTAGANFTYAERSMTRDLWGSKSSRLSAHSLRAFDMCCLCLAAARNPVVCNEGHLFCKECILDSLLQQSKDITAQKAYLAHLDTEEQAARERAREQARARILRQFEAEQTGVRRREDVEGGSSSLSGRIIEGERERRERSENKRREDVAESSKRKEEELALTLKRKATDDGVPKVGGAGLSILPDVIASKLRQVEDSALAEIEAEQRDARRSKLPAFWLPSLTPSEVEGRPKDIKLHTLCRAGSEKGHKLKMKNLIDVKFARLQDGDKADGPAKGNDKGQAICPSCKKGLSNSSKLFVVRSCGDVICSRCVDTILKPSFPSNAAGADGSKAAAAKKTDGEAGTSSCPACDKPLASSTSLDLAILALDREGTGFAAAGNAEAKKQGTAFQG
ncbi:unnamed protein product [Tilletia controversa]|uniref:RING-type domain-containing protein n=1 Tax=Tilletia controversa TaxID=13291 RepID=A0A8X7MSS5_9BASI|nr:hypothetical protein A4X06_0g4169 [Tilletia controversa]CAD6939509.1 unnamed protein product [Tilletia controversa]CAD6978335.1 unnamed protein product [Tilletia controversa]CAD6984906.1 unnamed protein product [Tilletia controversa]